MKLTPRGERVAAMSVLAFMLFLMALAGGIEAGEIHF